MPTPVHVVSRDLSATTSVGASLGTTVGAELVIDVEQAGALTLQFRAGATAGGVIVVEGLMNEGVATSWAPLPLKSTTGTPALITGTLTTLAANTNYRYEIPTYGLRRVRLRVSTALGSALADLSYVAHVGLTDPFQVVAQMGTWTVTGTPATGTSYNLNGAATTNLATPRNAATTLMSLNIFNGSAAKVFVKFYNKSSNPTLASDIPVLVIPVNAGELASPNLGPIGERFSTGLAMAIVANPADNDATAVGAGVKVKLTYI